MGTDRDQPGVHPGDIIQNSAGDIMLIAETHPWGVGAVQRWHDGVEQREIYHRLKPGQFAVCGTAHILPKEIAERRANSLATERQLERESGIESPVNHPFTIIRELLAAYEADADAMEDAIIRASAFMRAGGK